MIEFCRNVSNGDSKYFLYLFFKKTQITKKVMLLEQYSLEVDSSQRTSVMDRLCIFVKDMFINGRMILLVESTFGTEESLYDAVEEELESLNIHSSNLIGESFDWAAASLKY